MSKDKRSSAFFLRTMFSLMEKGLLRIILPQGSDAGEEKRAPHILIDNRIYEAFFTERHIHPNRCAKVMLHLFNIERRQIMKEKALRLTTNIRTFINFIGKAAPSHPMFIADDSPLYFNVTDTDGTVILTGVQNGKAIKTKRIKPDTHEQDS